MYIRKSSSLFLSMQGELASPTVLELHSTETLMIDCWHLFLFERAKMNTSNETSLNESLVQNTEENAPFQSTHLKSMVIFNCTIVTLYALAAILHVIGLLLLKKVKHKPDNQRKILENISFVELLFSIGAIPDLLYDPGTFSWTVCCDFWWTFIYTVFQMLMLFLITDKIACIHLHLRYPLIFTKRRVKIVLVSFWILGGLAALAVALSEIFWIERKVVQLYYSYSYLTLDAIIVIVLFGQFLYLFGKVREVHCRNKNITLPCGPSPLPRRAPKFLLPAIIVGTYALFNLPSSIMWLLAKVNGSTVQLVNKFQTVGRYFEAAIFSSDALTYIFLKKPIRNCIKELLCSSQSSKTIKLSSSEAIRMKKMTLESSLDVSIS